VPIEYELHFEERGHQYTVDGRVVPSVTQVLEAGGLVNLAGIPPDLLGRVQERGRRVHKAAELLLRGELDWGSIGEEDAGYVLALDRFLSTQKYKPIAGTVEKPFYCREFDYCGTPDVVVEHIALRPRRTVQVLVDWKTGMMPAVRYQLAAYAISLKRFRCEIQAR
jgi:hypothetical protein